MSASIKIKTHKASSRFVALDAQDKRRVLAEGPSVQSVVRKAQQTGRDFSMMYLPPKGKTYIF